MENTTTTIEAKRQNLVETFQNEMSLIGDIFLHELSKYGIYLQPNTKIKIETESIKIFAVDEHGQVLQGSDYVVRLATSDKLSIFSREAEISMFSANITKDYAGKIACILNAAEIVKNWDMFFDKADKYCQIYKTKLNQLQIAIENLQ